MNDTTASRLAAYPAGVQSSIRSDASTWRYGDVASSLDSFEETLEWAGKLTQEQRRYWRSGFWTSNELMKAEAVALVQHREGDDPNCEITLAAL